MPSSCEVPQLIANLASHLGLKVEENGGGGSDMSLRAWDRLSETSNFSPQVVLFHPWLWLYELFVYAAMPKVGLYFSLPLVKTH